MAGVVSIAGSMIGLWAVLYSNARAAEIFFQSRVMVFVMGQVNLFIHVIASSKPKTMEYLATIALYNAFGAFCSLYGAKVRTFSQHSVCCFLPLHSTPRFGPEQAAPDSIRDSPQLFEHRDRRTLVDLFR